MADHRPPALPVWAVVVTHNRPELLAVCLQALADQSHGLDGIIVWDNASDPPAAEHLSDHPAHHRVTWHRSAQNTGGAGGFADGIQAALAAGAGWVWLMDDDCRPQPDALQQLLTAVGHTWRRPPVLAASNVVWSDGTAHPMNRLKPVRGYPADARRPFPLRACSFVSCLVSTQRIRAVGLPERRYWLWLDDVEYTHRLVYQATAIGVPSSVVTHHTTAALGVFEAPADRLFFLARNWLWWLRYSPSLSSGERLSMAVRLVYTAVRCVIRSPQPARVLALWRGACSGWTTAP